MIFYRTSLFFFKILPLFDYGGLGMELLTGRFERARFLIPFLEIGP